MLVETLFVLVLLHVLKLVLVVEVLER